MVVCFDLGGVLVKIRHTWEDCLEATGHSDLLVPQTQLPEFPLFDAYQQGAVSTQEYLDALAIYLGVDSPAEAAVVHRAIIVEPYEGTDLLVSALSESGAKTGCLSNTNALHWEKMSGPGFPAVGRLDTAVLSHEVGLNKPEPEIFRVFEAKLGAAPGDVVYFDDGPANVEAGLKAGWDAVLIGPGSEPAKQMSKAMARRGLALFSI